ncbi:MAG: TfoX/Sxy family protein [Solirubrobacterales bacterium]
MAYDEQLADRVRDLVSAHSEVSERKMFGGIAFMIGGNMAVGVLGEDLIVRLDHDESEKALAEPGVREFDFTGRPAKGMVYVAPEQTSDDGSLAGWVEAGAGYAATLPEKYTGRSS